LPWCLGGAGAWVGSQMKGMNDQSYVLNGDCCCPEPIYFVDARTGKILTAPCKRRRCDYCGDAIWRKAVQARMIRGLTDVPLGEILLLTVTAPGEVEGRGAMEQGGA
jgi:hypothetical protein